MSNEILMRLNAIEAFLIQESEYRKLGHRIQYDPETGWSKNIMGVHVDPSCLNEEGLQVRLDKARVGLMKD